MDRFSIPSAYLRAMADQVASRGADAEAWLARAGVAIDGESVELRLLDFERLILDALQRTREPALALLTGQRLQVTAHGVLGYAVQSCASIRQAISLFESFMQLRFSLLALGVEERGDEFRVVYRETRPLGAIAGPVIEAVMMATKNLLDAVTPARIARVAFAFPKPIYAELARSLFDAEIRYGAPWSGFTLPRHIVDEPLRAADPDAFREAIAICERELARLPADPTLAGRVRRLLLEPHRGFPSLAVTARILHLGPRTLHRRLLDEGTSYRAILEDVRRTLALEHLRVGQLTVAEIANQLGYTDLANFRRAFKRWEKVPPTARRTNSSR
jgi:AraC-like DNA-binding protein